MSGVNGSNQDVDIDLSRIIAAVWERKLKILGAVVIAAAVTLVGTSLMKPSYKAESRLLIESRSPDIAGGGAGPQANDPLLDSLNITSQAQLLQSTDLIKRVAREMKLSQMKEFDPASQSMFPDPLVMLGLKKDPMKLDPEDRVIQAFRDKLNVYPVENSRVIAIEFSSRDPRLAAAIPNKMADVYLEIQSGAKIDTHSETAKWLQPEIASLTKRVQEAEKKVADYRSSNGLFQTSDTNSFSSRQLSDISAEVTRVRGERANAEARAENVRNALKAGRAPETLTDVVGSQVIQRLKESEANIQAQISDLATSLMEGHPRLKGLRAQLVGIRQQIDSETKKVLASLDSEAEVSRLRERQLMGQLNTLKADSAKAGEEEVGLRALEREATSQRQLLETYLSRYREATSRLEANSSPADARIVSRAVEPADPYFPKIVPIVIVVALATLVFGCLIVIILELFSGRALRPSGRRDDEDTVVTHEPVPVADLPAADVSSVHRMQDEAQRFDRAEPVKAQPVKAQSIKTQSIKPEPIKKDDDRKADEQAAAAQTVPGFTLASVADYLTRREVPVAISVSPGGDQGSTAAVMLARDIAERGRTVVVVDMTGSACPTRLMADNAKLPGVTDLLCGETAFGDAIHRDRLSEAHIVPQGISDPVRAMRGADRLSMIIDALSDAYDLVLVECGPAEIAGIGRLTRKQMAEIVLSVPGFKDADVAGLIVDFEKAGYNNLLVITETGDRQSPQRGRRRAA